METFALWSGLAFGFFFAFILWLAWMGLGFMLILSSAHHPTGGHWWQPVIGVLMLFLGVSGLGAGIYWLVVQ